MYYHMSHHPPFSNTALTEGPFFSYPCNRLSYILFLEINKKVFNKQQSKDIEQTREANGGLEACELYQYDRQYVQSQNPYENRSPICPK